MTKLINYKFASEVPFALVWFLSRNSSNFCVAFWKIEDKKILSEVNWPLKSPRIFLFVYSKLKKDVDLPCYRRFMFSTWVFPCYSCATNWCMKLFADPLQLTRTRFCFLRNCFHALHTTLLVMVKKQGLCVFWQIQATNNGIRIIIKL